MTSVFGIMAAATTPDMAPSTDHSQAKPDTTTSNSVRADSSTAPEEKKSLIACFLCRRKFTTVSKLRKHERKSQMHKDNLAKKKQIQGKEDIAQICKVSRKNGNERRIVSDKPTKKRKRSSAGLSMVKSNSADDHFGVKGEGDAFGTFPRVFAYDPVQDKPRISSFNWLLLENVEVFLTTESGLDAYSTGSNGHSAKNKRKPGQVGLRCMHCKSLPLQSRGAASVTFPGNIRTFGSHAHLIGSAHFKVCKAIPSGILSIIRSEQVKSKKLLSSNQHKKIGLQAFCVEIADRWGLVNTGHGIGLKKNGGDDDDTILADPPKKKEVKEEDIVRKNGRKRVKIKLSHDSRTHEHSYTTLSDSPAASDIAPVASSSSSGNIIKLAFPEDEHYLSPVQCYLRKHIIEAFIATEEDVLTKKGRKNPSFVGQIGIRCSYCASTPMAERARRSVLFPSAMRGLYDSSTKMLNVHLDDCCRIPVAVKKKICELRQFLSKSNSPREYYANSAQALGMVDGPNGITLHQHSSLNLARESVKSGGSDHSEHDSDGEEKNGIKARTRKLLSHPSDKKYLSDLHCFSRENLEVFSATESDIETFAKFRDGVIAPGQVGIRCIHCTSFDHNGRAKFPASIGDIYCTVRKFQYDHLSHCSSMPKECKLRLASVNKKNRCKNNTARYYIAAAENMGLKDFPQGMFFHKDNARIVPSSDDMFDFGTNSMQIISDAEISSSDSSIIEKGSITSQTLRDATHLTLPSFSGSESYVELLRNIFRDDDTQDGTLVRCKDRRLITDFKFALLKQLRVCHFTASDRSTGNRNDIEEGYPGVSCGYCENRKNFASTQKALTKSGIPSFFVHLMECKNCPVDIRRILNSLRKDDYNQRYALPKGSLQVFNNRLWRRLHSLDTDDEDSQWEQEDSKDEICDHDEDIRGISNDTSGSDHEGGERV